MSLEALSWNKIVDMVAAGELDIDTIVVQDDQVLVTLDAQAPPPGGNEPWRDGTLDADGRGWRKEPQRVPTSAPALVR